MNRIELLPENYLVTTLKSALTEIEKLKQKQFIGSDSLRPQILSSNKVYDFTAQLDTLNIPNLYRVWVLITFTADNQLNPYTRPFAELFDMTGAAYPFGSLDSYSIFEGPPSPLTPHHDDGVTQQQLLVNSTTQFRLKLYLQASDRGEYSLDVTWGTPAP